MDKPATSYFRGHRLQTTLTHSVLAGCGDVWWSKSRCQQHCRPMFLTQGNIIPPGPVGCHQGCYQATISHCVIWVYVMPAASLPHAQTEEGCGVFCGGTSGTAQPVSMMHVSKPQSRAAAVCCISCMAGWLVLACGYQSSTLSRVCSRFLCSNLHDTQLCGIVRQIQCDTYIVRLPQAATAFAHSLLAWASACSGRCVYQALCCCCEHETRGGLCGPE